ncbi:TlpA family protein disulfide reductase, partial [Singulisphaera rosea]
AKRMEGKPFALLGVNSDDDKAKLRDRLKADGITWRSWCDGGDVNHPGPIAERYNTFVRPTIYVLDPRGIIRAKFLGSVAPKRLDAIVDALVAEVSNR